MRMQWSICALPLLAWPAAPSAQERAEVVACDTLLAVRRIDAGPAVAGGALSEPGCRRIARGDVGTVERRALIGGVPYECLTVAGADQCLWVVP